MSILAAFERLCENLNSPAFERSVGADAEEISFLSRLMNDPVVQSVVGVRIPTWAIDLTT